MELLSRIADALLVNISLASLYVLLPILVFHWANNSKKASSITTIIASAMCLQAVSGTLWTIFTPESLHKLEPFIYFLLLFVLFKIFPIPSTSERKSSSRYHTPYFLLTLILGGGILLRIIHPLQQAALGQSDAYSHLYFIRQIIEKGVINDAIYPPGFHWVAALPLMLFPLDPYMLARYGGVFFGILLILAIWNLASLSEHKTTALMAAFFVACFPASILLMKTTVGVYANQFGLFLLPVILARYVVIEKGTKKDLFILGLLFIGLLISVPIMSINLVLLITADLILKVIRGQIKFTHTRIIVLFVLLLIPLITLIFFIQTHLDFFLSSSGIISSAKRPETILAAIQTLILNFIQIKRIGFSSPLYDSTLVMMGSFIVSCLIVSWYRKDKTFIFISIWAFLTFLQTATGIFQFSAYQRSGWELIMTFCLLGGYTYWWLIIKKHILKAPLNHIVLTLLISSTLISLRFYPRHFPVLSASENNLILLVRYLNEETLPTDKTYKPFTFEQTDKLEMMAVIPRLPQTIIMRQFTNFTHGDPVTTLLAGDSAIKYIPIGRESAFPSLDSSSTSMVLLDSCVEATQPPTVSRANLMQPSQLNVFLQSRRQNCTTNDKIRDWVKGLDQTSWDITLTTYDDIQLYFINSKNQK